MNGVDSNEDPFLRLCQYFIRRYVSCGGCVQMSNCRSDATALLPLDACHRHSLSVVSLQGFRIPGLQSQVIKIRCQLRLVGKRIWRLAWSYRVST